MNNLAMSLRRMFGFGPTVDGVISEFTSIVERLEALDAYHTENIRHYENELAFSKNESARAKLVADKIRGLIS